MSFTLKIYKDMLLNFINVKIKYSAREKNILIFNIFINVGSHFLGNVKHVILLVINLI